MNRLFSNARSRGARFVVALLVMCLSTQKDAVAQNFWQQTNGPGGGNIQLIAINSSGHIFVGTYGGGIFRSTNNGDSWTAVNNGLIGNIVEALAINSSGHIFVKTYNGGIFRSINNGDSWTVVNSNNLTGTTITTLVINSSGHIFAGTLLRGIYRSTNNGDSWTAVNNGLAYLDVHALAINSSGHIFAGTNLGKIFRSTDNGESWTEVYSALTNNPVHALAINSSGHVFGGTQIGIFRSLDNGVNWTVVNSGLTNLDARALVLSSNGYVFAGTNLGGIFRSENNGENWTATNNGLTNTDVIALATNANGHIFVGTNLSGVFRSTNNGDGWAAVNNGLTNTDVGALVINSSADIFAGTAGGGVFRSSDNGAGWKVVNSGLTSLHIGALAINSSGFIFAGSQTGVFRSKNDGDSWTVVNNGLTNTYISTLATNSNGNIFAGTRQGRIFRLNDNGDGWSYVESGLTNNYIYALAITTKGDIFAGTNDRGIFRSSDNGANWIAVNRGLTETDVRALFINTNGDIFAGLYGVGGIFRSRDNGDNWTVVKANILPSSFAVNSKGDIFAGTYGAGVFQSTDDGVSWNSINSGLTNLDVYALAVNSNGYLYAGTYGGGVFRSVIPISPAAPQNLRATAGDRQITLNWNANTEPDFLRYRIYRGTAPNPTTPIDSVSGAANTSKTITGLTNGTRYYFHIRAVDSSLNQSSFSNEVSATPGKAPTVTTNPATNVGTTSATLNGTANANGLSTTVKFQYGTTTSYGNEITAAQSPVSGNSVVAVSVALNDLDPNKLYHFRVIGTNSIGSASGADRTFTTPDQRDTTPPALELCEPVRNPNIGTPVPVCMNASDASGVQSVILYYRIAGKAAFDSLAMVLQSGTRYSANIPASAITNRGAEFYAQASDVFGNVATTPRYPVRVICPNGITAPFVQPNDTSAKAYRLFSLPLEVDDKTPAGFLATNPSLGSAEAGKYRWYAFERSAGALREYPNFGGVLMTPDMGFALLVNLPNVHLKTGRGVTVATTSPYNIVLPAGWSLIGNPFNFNVPFDSLRVSAGTFELCSFVDGWKPNTAGLEPWQGYAIRMERDATLSIHPGVAGLNSGASFYEVANNTAENWLIQITAEDGRSTSRFNFVGQHEAAHDGHDAWDLHEPLALATGVGLRLHAAQNEEALKADIRGPSAQGHVWNFTCRVAGEEEVLRLAFAGVASVPSAFEVLLIDNATARAYDLRTQAQIEFAVSEGREKQFTLLAGTAEFVRSRDEIAAAPPSDFVVLENFPNPFNPATQINYILPEERHVRLEIYNLRGQRVATLVNETQARGTHTVVWRAESLGSGVYFIKLSAGLEVKMRKAVLMK